MTAKTDDRLSEGHPYRIENEKYAVCWKIIVTFPWTSGSENSDKNIPIVEGDVAFWHKFYFEFYVYAQAAVENASGSSDKR